MMMTKKGAYVSISFDGRTLWLCHPSVGTFAEGESKRRTSDAESFQKITTVSTNPICRHNEPIGAIRVGRTSVPAVAFVTLQIGDKRRGAPSSHIPFPSCYRSLARCPKSSLARAPSPASLSVRLSVCLAAEAVPFPPRLAHKTDEKERDRGEGKEVRGRDHTDTISASSFAF